MVDPVLVESISEGDHALEETCDLCGATSSSILTESSPDNFRIVMCSRCRLMYASPKPSGSALDTFYDESFSFDPGSRAKADSGRPRDKETQKEEGRVDWALTIIHRFTEVSGKRVLDLRCRTGALSAALKAEGAETVPVEPFEANANYIREVRGLSNVLLLPFTQFDELMIPDGPAFDVVNALTHHVLAHTRSPRSLLTRCFEVLKPGGYLFLDEKDVLLPARYKTLSIFDTGRAHLYHLTLDTTARYLRSVGFELIECEIDDRRVSDFQHIRAVARKPEGGAAPLRPDRVVIDGPSAEEIRRRLRWLERTWGLRRSSIVARRKARRLLARARTIGSPG